VVRKLLLLITLCAAPTAVLAEFTASVDRRVIDENDVVVLELQRDAQVFVGNPDLSSLEDDFRVLGTQRSSQFTIAGGRTRSVTTWTVTLQPRRRGTLQIPSIEYDGERTRPITVTVTQPSPQELAALERTVFFETEISKESIWVQEQLLYTVRLYYAADAVLFGDLPPPPAVRDTVVQALGDSRPGVEVRDGVRYNVIEQRYAVIPQRSGELVVPPETFTGAVRIADRGQTRRKNIRIGSDGHRIEVKAQPAGWPDGAPWLPARGLMLTERWDPTPPRLRAGEPATRTLELVARGIAASALPELPRQDVPGARTYTNQPNLDEGMATGDFIATRIESTVIIPERAGTLELPEVRVPWFDVELGEVRMAVVPARRLLVAAGAGRPTDGTVVPPPEPDAAAAPAPAPEAPPPEDGNGRPQIPWLVLGAALAIVLAGAVAARLGGSRPAPSRQLEVPPTETPPPAAPRPEDSRRVLLAACARGDAPAARRTLAVWRRGAGAARTFAAELDALTLELDRTLFAADTRTWDGAPLAALVQRVDRARAARRPPAPPALPPLHPPPLASEGT
jgi:hypothetical protein